MNKVSVGLLIRQLPQVASDDVVAGSHPPEEQEEGPAKFNIILQADVVLSGPRSYPV